MQEKDSAKAANDEDRSRTRKVEDENLAPEGTAFCSRGGHVLWQLGTHVVDGKGKQLRDTTSAGANIVPLLEERQNPDGTTKTKTRPIALLETPMKLIESVSVDQHADHIIALMQEPQVGFRVRDGAEAMIGAVRRFLKSGTNRILMQGDISNACGSASRLSVLEAVRKHDPDLGPLCCERWDCCRDARAGRHRQKVRTSSQCCDGCLARKHAEQGNILPDFLAQDARPAGRDEC